MVSISKVFDHPQADIILESSDGVQFKIRKIHLQANSQVFEDMIEVASSSSKETEPQIVPLEEKASELELFLPYLVRGTPCPKPDYWHLLNLFALADKYGADLAMNALTANLRLQTVEFPLYTFALAAAYDRVDVQVEALQQFDRSPNPATKPFWLNLIPMELRSKIPLRTMWKVLELHEAVEDREEGTWAELALKMDWKDDCYGDIRLEAQ